ncbi:cxxc_20_cxxc protein [Lentibacillus halodurans]|uniref:Cxxc_20_cxxc protein n=1 Tax=Lentibacillus halodurans TaxID=237679 RepID=A0A1I0W7D0_9BACI|nr:TIGR04104 family putative zinc finger protein [Lentibacillus halodurans]SFA84669.1 cxxc_20_cxxc protein [Lentibacillus halodurans]
MPTCQHCSEQWNWKQTIKAMFSLDVRLTCPYCGSKQHLTAKARRRMNLGNFSIPIAIPLGILVNTPFMSFGILIGTFILVITINLFLIELSNEADPGWK